MTSQSIVAATSESSSSKRVDPGGPIRFDAPIEAAPPEPKATRSPVWIIPVVLAGALVSLTVGLLSRHDPRSKGYFQLFFSDPIHLKAWFATAAATLAVTQLFTAAWIFRKLPWRKPRWVNFVHRWTGRTAFVCTLPVAYHCVFKLGYADYTDRVMAHSLLGSAFYGMYVTKVSIVRLHRFPRFVLPIAGGTLFAVLIAVWYTSAFWFFREIDFGF